MVPPAEELPVLVEVDEVNEELLADGADEAGWVPKVAGAKAGGCHADVAVVNASRALEKEKQ